MIIGLKIKHESITWAIPNTGFNGLQAAVPAGRVCVGGYRLSHAIPQ